MTQIDWCKKFQKVISTGNQNSYKFAVGMAIVEIGKKVITYLELAEKLAEYYHRNVIRFKIRETTNINQQPKAHQIIIEFFRNKEITHKLSEEDKKEIAKQYVSINQFRDSVLYYVLPCWEGAQSNDNLKSKYKYPAEGDNSFFSYSKKDAQIELKDEFYEIVKNNKQLLLDLTVLEWVRFLEKFNNIPNLVNKISYKKPKRNLSKFIDLFINLGEKYWKICCICGNKIEKEDDLTLDHVIPFDYIWSDDLWNLVPAHKNCNSSKNMKLGNDYEFNRLFEQIDRLYDFYYSKKAECKNENMKDKIFKDLKSYLIYLFENKDDLKNKIKELRQNCIHIGYKIYEPKVNTNQI